MLDFAKEIDVLENIGECKKRLVKYLEILDFYG